MHKGFVYVVYGMRLLFQSGIKRFVIIPILINFILFTLFIVFGLGSLLDYVDDYIQMLPDWLNWIEWLVNLTLTIVLMLVGFICCLQLANLIAAPFNSALAESVEKKLNPELTSESVNWHTVIQQAGPAMANEFRKLGYFVIRAIPIGILFLIPVLNVAAPLIWTLFTVWLLAIEYTDYPMSNHDISFLELRARLKEKRFVAIGFGGAMLLLTITPIINFFAVPIGVAAATVMSVKELNIASKNSLNQLED
ncbi:MAG: sulfate transporter CysZ [Gammaproteobacteria bacterium]